MCSSLVISFLPNSLAVKKVRGQSEEAGYEWLKSIKLMTDNRTTDAAWPCTFYSHGCY